ncbi:MAG: Zn(2+)-responsive transcriptional regulator [Pseudomonadales bacterium]|nr:Zn(2+)-responsive transcriptional regulator [Pseudomonadales bacterium]MBO6563937.1 Zn(2+)-responsive transcriptional regulator [Pseudomonadales bacterium]MBO6595942.1 Zn(2+)-responsive transcriptional regulator [Pseudomonadales bacterium]MBO6656808.1 Zn(2+)-responsive transcriptional regulator [Pseudomonadales bacterium]MBO6702547.1 Zn(2+)-responsive transcriptional regulator [Pseudomonadales bacterium]
MSHLRIGELASRTETSVETLRYYESEGLIPEPRRSDAGYRLYTTDDVDRVRFIRRARAMDFSLREVGELLSLQVDREHATCGEVKELAEQKLGAIEIKMAELQKMKLALRQITDACEGGELSAVHCTILNALES